MRQSISTLIHRWGRRALVLAVGLYFVLGVALLVARYAVAPTIDGWRPQIAQAASRALGEQVTLGPLQLVWRGWRPQLRARDVHIADARGRPLLTVPQLQAQFQWLPLGAARPIGLSLDVRGMDLSIERLPDGRLRVLGQVLDDTESSGTPAWLSWLLSQPRIAFHASTLRWHDRVRQAPELLLRDVEAVLQRQGPQGLGLALDATAPEVGSARLALRARLADRTALDALLDPPPARRPTPSAVAAASPAPEAASDGAAAGVGDGMGHLGQFGAWLHLSQAQAPAWRAWLDLPPEMGDGRLDARFWLQSEAQASPQSPRLTAQMRVQNLQWALGVQGGLQVPRAEIWAQGGLDQWRQLAQSERPGPQPQAQPQSQSQPQPQSQPQSQPQPRLQAQSPAQPEAQPHPRQNPPDGLAFQLRIDQARLRQADWFDHALDFGSVSAQGRVSHAGQWMLDLQRFAWQNPDIALQGAGRWLADGGAGSADFQGTIARARFDAIHRYLPREVNADARSWLEHGLQAGTLQDARWLLRGKLDEFPFTQDPQAGDFRVWGPYRDVQIEFVPQAPTQPGAVQNAGAAQPAPAAQRASAAGAPAARPSAAPPLWPLLARMDGTANLHRMDLRLTASRALMEPIQGQPIAFSGLRARIPDLEHDATLQVSGQTAADGGAYLGLIRQTPLAHLLRGVFDEATGAGDWRVALSLTIPLMHTLETRVQGRVDLQDATLRFLPQSPAFQQIDGSLHFDEHGVKIAQPLQARWLGGPMRVSGALGGSGASGLDLHGRVTAAALAAFVGVPGMRRITGAADYQARLAQQGHDYVLDLESDTRGLALDFPAPLAKPDTEPRSLRVRWSDADAQADTLDVHYGADVVLALRHPRGQKTGPYFQQAAIGIGQSPDTQADGLRLSLSYPLFDLDYWNRLVNEFSIPRRGQTSVAKGAARRPLWPDLALLSLQTDQLRLLDTRLDQAVLRVTRTPAEQWSMNLRSRQTTGTLKWQEQDGKVVGRMSGRFARLSLGDDPRDSHSLLPQADPDDETVVDDDLDIPGIVLQADELRLYGRAMGALALEGTRDRARHDWVLSHLRMGDDAALLQGTGVWRLRGPDRGLTLKADVAASDLGEWLTRAGWPSMLSGGQGSLKGQFEWRNLPWHHDKADLQGQLQIELGKGRFLKIGSQTAKLLEVLSLQSLTRLNRLEQGLLGLPKDGFPFDRLLGSLSLRQGVVQAHDYKVIGPVGTILLEGDTNILDKTFNLQAVIVPNLDISGAALAAGIAINPLVGLGAFVTQWLLKTPLAKAMTLRYHVTGTWDDPKIQDVPVAQAQPVKPAS
ncbi:YhdP family protein [Castellaniella caeni]